MLKKKTSNLPTQQKLPTLEINSKNSYNTLNMAEEPTLNTPDGLRPEAQKAEKQKQAFGILRELFPGENGGQSEFDGMAGWILKESPNDSETVVLANQTGSVEVVVESAAENPDFRVTVRQLPNEETRSWFELAYGHRGDEETLTVKCHHDGSSVHNVHKDTSITFDAKTGKPIETTSHIGEDNVEIVINRDNEGLDENNKMKGYVILNAKKNIKKWEEETGFNLKYERDHLKIGVGRIDIDPIATLRSSTLAWKDRVSRTPVVEYI